MNDILEYLDVDISNALEAAMRGLIFTSYLAALVYCIVEYGRWDAGAVTMGAFWMRVGGAYAFITACICAMAWLQRRGGFAVWSKEERRGFDVITKK